MEIPSSASFHERDFAIADAETASGKLAAVEIASANIAGVKLAADEIPGTKIPGVEAGKQEEIGLTV